MKVTIFGTGYVGLVQAAVLSGVGHDVCCVDVDADKISKLQRGEITIYEPGLEQLINNNLATGHLCFTSAAKEGVEFADVIFIAVGTPQDEDGSADLRYVLNVAKTIATCSCHRKIVINKSTVPVGTAQQVSDVLRETREELGLSPILFSVVSNPEFLKEGSAVSDCMRPDRIVIGLDEMDVHFADVKDLMRELYAPFNRNHEKILFMTVKSAELTKYAANCMLATKISFMNEMANIADKLGADIEQVRKGIGSDERIGYHFIYPGCGYGGSCFPKDVQALIRSAENIGYESGILKAVENTNFHQKRKLFEQICAHFGGESNLKGRTFALWGLAFKPKTDDMREAPSRVLMEALWAAGSTVQAYDPKAMEEAQRLYFLRNDLVLMGTKEATLKGADALIICTEWQNFKAPDFNLIYSELSEPVIFDGRNLFEPIRMAARGFTYWSIGREVARPD
ncbi:UDP-glucose/GDP-mannose dehydrogenase family protein [Vibrio sp. Y2-5]|uniref:UDP-glucose dehydrogenase family protein n=1 Tax=Vibrio sp. Y2-5 TaxID=2743977 RepID=UPI001660FFD4|nr:UDP-glucose/GDP-mannose dehydrogenase family protein [Vibrio sp. Y2-5]MBD0786244.1 UDP-glucose/GDP-mannose dehydrogenase family protein [Vibrio sp. Y2-5]